MKILSLLILFLILLNVSCALRIDSITDCIPETINNARILTLPVNESLSNKGDNNGGREGDDDEFEVVPEYFKKIHFQNFSYPYSKPSRITLRKKEFEYQFQGSFDRFLFGNAHFIDLTGDGQKEAIIHLTHSFCGSSCDGGAALIYIYEMRKNGLNLIWRNETGSLGYGCGLKTFSVKGRMLTTELFGNCIGDKKESGAIGEGHVRGLTRKTFEFNGRTFMIKDESFTPSAEIKVTNYQSAFVFEQ